MSADRGWKATAVRFAPLYGAKLAILVKWTTDRRVNILSTLVLWEIAHKSKLISTYQVSTYNFHKGELVYSKFILSVKVRFCA